MAHSIEEPFSVRTARRAAPPVSPEARYTVSDLARFYNLPEEYDGRGQKIALLVPHGGLDTSDLKIYFEQLGLSHQEPTIIEVGDAKNNPCGAEDLRRFLISIGAGYEGEPRGHYKPSGATPALPEDMPYGSSLFKQVTFTLEAIADVEIAGATAPGAELRVYMCGNSARGIAAAIEQARGDGVSVMSSSCGVLENNIDPESFMAPINDALKRAAMDGITCCFASGDSGSRPEREASTEEGLRPPLDVYFPASSPYALSCGGTAIVQATPSNGGWELKERVWNEMAFTFRGASGGGFSKHYPCPFWQRYPVAPRPARGWRQMRGVPDVASNAAGSSGVWLWVGGLNAVAFGTSAVSPFYAGLMARLNQGLGGKPRFMPPLLYHPRVRGTFHDVIAGANIQGSESTKYYARRGWDPCTGLGTPDGRALLSALKELRTEDLPDIATELPRPATPTIIRDDLLIAADDGQVYFVPAADWKRAVVEQDEQEWLTNELLGRGVALAAIPERTWLAPGQAEDPGFGALIACYLVNISGLRKSNPFERNPGTGNGKQRK